MDITGQFEQIEIFLADDRLVAVLKKMAPSLVSQVEVDRVSGHQAPHAPGQRLYSGSNQQVKMVKTGRTRFIEVDLVVGPKFALQTVAEQDRLRERIWRALDLPLDQAWLSICLTRGPRWV